MKGAITYLNFDGQTREAMTFYQQCLGGELMIPEFPGAPCAPGFEGRTMYAALMKGGVPFLAASDTPPGMPLHVGNHASVSVECESMEEIRRIFAALAEGGEVKMPLADMFWGAHWGFLKDRYGVQWMFNYTLSA
ncbi:MAG: VOC family protein [Bryobacterales bacterium]|nr:VOC family protein [Bryobacterales bacterium]